MEFSDMNFGLSGMNIDFEHLAHLVRTHHPHSDALENVYRTLRKLGVDPQPPREVEVIFSDPRVRARQGVEAASAMPNPPSRRWPTTGAVGLSNDLTSDCTGGSATPAGFRNRAHMNVNRNHYGFER
ncbi:hypothetical protein [Bradyrhizobium sp. 23AC]